MKFGLLAVIVLAVNAAAGIRSHAFSVIGHANGYCEGNKARLKLVEEARADAYLKASDECRSRATRVSKWVESEGCDYFSSGEGWSSQKADFECLRSNTGWETNSSEEKTMSPIHTHVNFKEIIIQSPEIKGDNIKVWSIRKTDVIRINLIEFTGSLARHKHPDADHSIMILEGKVEVGVGDDRLILSEGDFLSIPKNVPHEYKSISEKSYFVSMDAPYYDPAKTIRL